jgi:UDP-glucose 4-epimerase
VHGGILDKKILVTGGAGYIGSLMVWKLCDLGYFPIVVDNLSAGNVTRLPPKIPFYSFDLADAKQLSALFSNEKIDLVMHFAASTKVDESVKNPYKYYYNNFFSMLTLLDQMERHDINQFIFSSTAAIFGEPIYSPVDEKHPNNPINPYGKSKLMCEMALNDFALKADIRFVCLRYFNAAGADPFLRTGFDPKNQAQLIPIVLSAASDPEKIVNVYGRDFDTPDGTGVRDYIHVSDLCDAHISAMQYLFNGGKSDYFNLGNGQGYSVQEVITMVEKITGQRIQVVNAKRRQGDPAFVIADSKKIFQVLGWLPQFPGLEKIVGDSWRWMRQNQAIVTEIQV